MNQNGEQALNFDIPWRIYDAILPPGTDDESPAAADELPASLPRATAAALTGFDPGTAVAEDEAPRGAWTAFEGLYVDPGYGELHVVDDGGKLRAHYYAKTFDIVRAKGDEFALKLDIGWAKMDVPATFLRDQGEITGLAIPLEASAPPIVFRRVMTVQ